MSRLRRSTIAASKRKKLSAPERLEHRLVMDGAGFVRTDPPEDPDSIVGEAGIVANDDYLQVAAGTKSLRISVLDNDQLPEGAAQLTLKSVSATRLGASVSIAEDGKHLIYTAGEEGFQAWDTFYYIVQTEDGRLGKANVNLGQKTSLPVYPTPIYTRFSVLEDSPEQRLDIIGSDYHARNLKDPEIVAVTTPSLGGSVRISDDGKFVWYQPAAATHGREWFDATARGSDGEEVLFRVNIDIKKPYQINTRFDGGTIDFGTGSVILNPLANDQQIGPTPITPFVESVSVPDYAGTISVMEDGRRLLYEPAPDFQGGVEIRYTIRYGEAEHQTTSSAFSIHVAKGYQAVENWFAVDPAASAPTELDVLANDPIYQNGMNSTNAHYLHPLPPVTIQLAEVSAGSAGGSISISEDGKNIIYKPADGFLGDETFQYTVESSNGERQTATVTVHVAAPVSDPSGVDRFATVGELQQFLIDRAARNFGGQFGQYIAKYAPLPEGYSYPVYYSALQLVNAAALDATHSETNTQVNGVDEADIVETDGRYVYTFSDGQLAIVDLVDPTAPMLVSLTQFEGKYDKMYLQGDRVTLLRTGSRYQYYGQSEPAGAEVLVLDLGDRSAPTVVERTEIDGYIADSRAIGDRVHLVVQRDFQFPEIGGEWIVDPVPPTPPKDSSGTDSTDAQGGIAVVSSLNYYDRGEPGVWQNESLDEYLARVRGELIDTGLPSYRTYNGANELVAEGLFTEATDLHTPVTGDDLVVSLVTLDAGDDLPGPVASATSFIADDQTTVYMSTESAYVFAYDYWSDATTIYKLDLASDGSTPLVASGEIRGKLLNQFAADEHDGTLRVATTQQEREYYDEGRSWRQLRLFNNLQILEQNGPNLEVVGEITNLAPTETIHSVRFMGERAFVVTFRRIDPLFAIDLSDPTTPTVEGALKIPGFSNYLHPVGTDYVIGIGRDADEITGRMGPLQITLFNVADLASPQVADQLTFEGARWVNSEAWFDHHAVAYFAESGVLAIPIDWTETIENSNSELYGLSTKTERHSAIFTFQVDVSGETASIEATGRVDNPSPIESAPYISPFAPIAVDFVVTTNVWFPPQQLPDPTFRALRIGDSLITVSAEWLQVHQLDDPSVLEGEVFFGNPARPDSFTLQEDSGENVLDVLANDFPAADGEVSGIQSVKQPTTGGVVTISADGRSLNFTPDEDFYGAAIFTYTVLDPLRGEQSAVVTLHVENTPDDPDAVDDEFTVAIDAGPTMLDVLANDENPDSQFGYSHYPRPYVIDTVDISYTASLVFLGKGLTISEIGETSAGGTVELNDYGQLVYTPAPGFSGTETFEYTITNQAGLTDTATVRVQVGAATNEEATRPTHRPSRTRSFTNTETEPVLLSLDDDEIANSRSSFRPTNRGFAREQVESLTAERDAVFAERTRTANPGRRARFSVAEAPSLTAEDSEWNESLVDSAIAIDWGS